MPKGRARRLLHELVQHSHFTLDGVMLSEDAFERMDFVDVVSERCLGVVQLGRGSVRTGAMGDVESSCCS
jgi:hypothetical protein